MSRSSVVIVVIIMCILCSVALSMMMPTPPNWLKDTLSLVNDVTSHRKIKMRPSDCKDDEIFLRFKNKHARCIHFGVHREGENDPIHRNQSANHGCINAEYHVCVPKNGSVKAKGTTHCGGVATLRSSRMTYDTLKNHDKDSEELGWWDWIVGNKTEKGIIPIRHECKHSYSRFYLNGDSDEYWGNPAACSNC
jgi:hypothetical protein